MSAMPQEPSRDSSIRLYAELLPNIRQVTLYVSLPPSSNKCNIALSTDCQTVETSYDAESVKLKLPARVSEASRERLRFDDEQKKGELSFRLVVDENRHVSGHEEGDGVNGPWSAVDLGPNTKLRCRRCQNTLLRYHSRINRDSNVGESSGEKTSSTMIFKDLPSQNWAEMMDFWHCHKPDEPGHGHDHNHSHGGDGQNPENTRDQNGAVKGYGASNRVVATAGTVLVDVSSFVLAEDDGVGLIKVRFLLNLFSTTCVCFEYSLLVHLYRLYYFYCLATTNRSSTVIVSPSAFLLLYYSFMQPFYSGHKEGGLITLASSPHQGDGISLRFDFRYSCPRTKKNINIVGCTGEREKEKKGEFLDNSGSILFCLCR